VTGVVIETPWTHILHSLGSIAQFAMGTTFKHQSTPYEILCSLFFLIDFQPF